MTDENSGLLGGGETLAATIRETLSETHGNSSNVSLGIRESFAAERTADWEKLGVLTKKAKGRVERLGPNEVVQAGNLYRTLTADLAYARRQFPGDPLLRQLEQQVHPARSLVYDRARSGFSVRSFYRDRYWKLIHRRSRLVALSILLMAVPAVLVFLWALRDPDRAATLLGERFSGGRTSWADQGYSATEQSAVATAIFVNNIRVSFLAYASGILFGFGTAYLLVFNGALLGIVAGLSTADQHGSVAFTLIVAHGILELSVIAIAAAAGLGMGKALASPGLETRRVVLRREAAAGVEIVLGTVPFFILAGLVEGFFTPAGFGPIWAGVVGVVFGGGYWVLVVLRGRERAAT
jgi:uncharacterized membrane protein SpoIIM required for sporulation